MTDERRRPTDEDYEAMSRAVEAGDYTVGPMELGATLRMGRPRLKRSERDDPPADD